MLFQGQQTHGLGKKLFPLILLTLVLMSCVGRFAPSPITLSDIKALPKGETIVFGRVKVIWKGETRTWDVLKAPFYIYVLPERDPAPVRYNLEGDGTFLWHLSPGGYTITYFDWTHVPWTMQRRKIGRAFASFVVPEATAPVYIGTLKITLEKERDLISIEDEYEHALKGVRNEFPEIKGDATKSLMHLEKAR